MRLLTDAAYAAAAVATLPVWLTRMARSGKLRTDWRGRFGDAPPWRRSGAPRILVHAVSVGEVNAVRLLVESLASQPDAPEIAVSATTDTGIVRASELYAKDHRVFRFPFDFSRAVRRFLDAVAPDLVVLTELEVWPNFVRECRARGIPVMVVNGRLSARSIRRYRRIRPLVGGLFRSLDLVAVQSDEYAARFREMGVPAAACVRTGTMKWDTAQIADSAPGAEELARDLGIDRRRPLVVAGSTAPGEESLLLGALPPGVQLLCAPRKPEWFDRAAASLPGCVRRSLGGTPAAAAGTSSAPPRLFLLDTMGELRKAYSLADVVVVGRTFELPAPLHGSDMMEPVALGKATIIGPDVANFQETADRLLSAGGLVQTSAAELPEVLRRLVGDAAERRRLAEHGRDVIREEQGATLRTRELILSRLERRGGAPRGSRSQSTSTPPRSAAHV